MSVILFWLLLILAIYSYFIYPLVLAVLIQMRPRAGQAAPAALPSLSLIVTAYNEEGRIREKLDNSLAIDYSELEIIIASDCSSDATDDIVREYADRGVKLVRANERLGKENAQWCAIQQASGDIVVFSDVATQIPADALRKLAAYFADTSVGAVSSEDRFISQAGEVAGEGAYVKYEMWLRRMESQLVGLVGLSGSFFAARKEVCQNWDIHSPSDFNTGLNCARAGYRAVTAPDVLGFYKDLKDPKKEYQRKVRTVLRGITAIARHPDVLSVTRYGLFAWQVWSHKIMRWAVPWLLVLLFLVSFRLTGTGWFYTLSFLGQLAFYGIAIAAHINERVRANAAARLIYFFVHVNIGLADALCRFLGGKRMTTWQPSAR
ncbi:MAG TPA: glycosyltransferase family 2 protein [Spongiibacteraceae bacterium]|nr:glycosyltransferase family 2 protein [Spongiibacteraceae bacterium]